MSLIETLRIAATSLLASPLRSFLTILGVMIGTASVITLLSVGESFRASVLGQFSSFGADVLTITPGGLFDDPNDTQTPRRLTLADSRALLDAERAPAVAAAAAEMNASGTIAFRNRNVGGQIRGVTPNIVEVQQLRVALGRFLSEADQEQRTRVAVVGWDLARELFGEDDPLGKIINLNGFQFEVVGVLESTGALGFQNNLAVFVPLSVVQQRLAPERVQRGLDIDQIVVRATSVDTVGAAETQVRTLLRERHGTTSDGRDGFFIQANRDILNSISGIISGITYFLAFIGAIALLVGGVGIMNIMLVSVTQRTREIGLRRAVGARRSDILLQFLIEAVVLSLSGGFFGILIGYALTTTASMAVAIATRNNLLGGGLTLSSVIVATVFSILVGVIFGFYPAQQAARQTPIDALRYE